MEKILVTGGAGYIGSVLTKDLLRRGYAVRIFDKLYFGKEHLKDIKNKIEIIQGDLRKLDEKIFKDIGAVIHLGGLSNDPTAEFNPQANMEINADATHNLAKICAKKGINRFTYASSASIYDRGLTDSDILQDEKTEISEPKMAYSLSKFRGEKALLKISEEYLDFSPVILRQGTVYGYSPRMRYDLVVNTMVKSAFETGRINVLSGGIQWRPLVDVRDVSIAHIIALEAPEKKIKKQLFNVSMENTRMLDLAHRIKESLKPVVNAEIDVDYNFDRIDRSYRISGNKLEKELGFRYQWSIEDSVKDLCKRIKDGEVNDFENPKYYNIKWMEHLVNMEKRIKEMGGVF